MQLVRARANKCHWAVRWVVAVLALTVCVACSTPEATTPASTAAPAPTTTHTPAPEPTPTPETLATWNLCTGSMEPEITCLDQFIEKRVTTLADIDIGSVVGFRDTACWPDHDAAWMTSHRVIEMRETAQGMEYLTQGDANLDADCWIPFKAVKTVGVDIRKGLYPENAELREAVNATRAEYYAALHVYMAYLEAQCGTTDPAACALAGDAYDEGIRLYEAKESTKATFDCWLDSASRMERPGHIPFRC